MYLRRQQAAVNEINKRGLTLFHASVQVRPGSKPCTPAAQYSQQYDMLPAKALLMTEQELPLRLPLRASQALQRKASAGCRSSRSMNCVQALLAVGLLQLRPWRPRAVGALGVVASAINCYMCGSSPPHAHASVSCSCQLVATACWSSAEPPATCYCYVLSTLVGTKRSLSSKRTKARAAWCGSGCFRRCQSLQSGWRAVWTRWVSRRSRVRAPPSCPRPRRSPRSPLPRWHEQTTRHPDGTSYE